MKAPPQLEDIIAAEQEKYQKIFEHCRKDFSFFARHHLKIKNKHAKTVSLIPNAAQNIIHEALEKQKKKTGKVRAVVIKGRQQGVSTYVQARFFWQLIHNMGLRAYILTHLADSTQALFSMTRRFLEHLPLHRPELGKCNVNELYFSNIDSGYKVGTAGSSGIGRGETLQLFHGSEVAYWPKPEEHVGGILQAVPNNPGTEIVLESTANGTGNLFHKLCMDAASDTNADWTCVFVPWTLQAEYQITPTEEFEPDEEERHLISAYRLTTSQLNWRRHKVKELGDERRFRQEYPLSIQEAFIGDTERAFISALEVETACNPPGDFVQDRAADLIMGIDPARYGGDETGLCLRIGRVVTHIELLPKLDTMQLCGAIIKQIERFNPDKVFIDLGSFGAGIYDRLREQGYRQVQGVNFGGAADDKERYGNKRAEMYDRLKRWLNDLPCKLPDFHTLKTELTSIQFYQNSSGKLMMEKKEDMKKRGINSPNLADAFCLTFAENQNYSKNRYHQFTQPNYSTASWNPYNACRQ